MLTYSHYQFIPYDRTLELFFTGCSLNCKDCHNPQLQKKECGKYVNSEYIINEVAPYKNIAKSVHILGGEPLEQNPDDLYKLTNDLVINNFTNIFLFTGKTLSNHQVDDLFQKTKVKYIKHGFFDKNSESYIDDVTGIKLASKNQKIEKNKFL